MNMDQIAVLLIAAGASTRLGQRKQLLQVDGMMLLEKMARVALEAGNSNVTVVLGAFADSVRPSIEHLPVQILQNENWEKGMGTTIASGARFLSENHPETKAVIVLLCDQPFVHVDLLKKLVEKWQSERKLIVASRYGETFGAPAIFDEKLLPELAGLYGEKGAKSLMMKHLSDLAFIDFPLGTVDLDTMDDVERFARFNHSEGAK